MGQNSYGYKPKDLAFPLDPLTSLPPLFSASPQVVSCVVVTVFLYTWLAHTCLVNVWFVFGFPRKADSQTTVSTSVPCYLPETSPLNRRPPRLLRRAVWAFLRWLLRGAWFAFRRLHAIFLALEADLHRTTSVLSFFTMPFACYPVAPETMILLGLRAPPATEHHGHCETDSEERMIWRQSLNHTDAVCDA